MIWWAQICPLREDKQRRGKIETHQIFADLPHSLQVLGLVSLQEHEQQHLLAFFWGGGHAICFSTGNVIF